MKIISAFLSIFILMPAYFYMFYQILDAINANDVVWFIYWVYLPASIFVVAVDKIDK